MITKKLNAFTLSEMIVVLIVASIVIAMGFSVLNMVRKQVTAIQRNYQKKQTVELFESRLIRDFNSYNASFNKNSDELLFKNTKDSILYTFLKQGIVRQKDTFFIEVANKTLFLEGGEVSQSYIDALEINLTEQFRKSKIFVHKVKDATYYMNN